ncbi:MAG: hypothetical protein RLY20_329 [Verrucomicrobiota bacterium]
MLTKALLLAGITITSGTLLAAEGQAPAAETPKPAARPTAIPPASSKQGLTFEKDVKPLFEASCVKCHGAQKPKGNLRLDTLEGVLKGSEDGKVVTVGDSAKSKLVASIARINPKTAMPPEPRGPRKGGPGGQGGPGAAPKEGAPAGGAAAQHPAGQGGPGGPGGPGGRMGPPAKPLTAEEVGIVRAWIDQGAK